MNCVILNCSVNRLLKLFLMVSVFTVFLFAGAGSAYADRLEGFSLHASVDGVDGYEIAACDGDYENNTYISLRSAAEALRNSSHPFSCSYSYDSESELGCVSIVTGQKPGETYSGKAPTEYYSTLRLNYLCIDGKEPHYWTYNANSDIYISLTDFEMVFDLTVEYTGEDTVSIRTDLPFSPSLEQLDAAGYFDTLGGVVVGDITSGELLYFNNASVPHAIASTTKLMTAMLVFDAIDEGRVTMDDMVTVSERAARISVSNDGTIAFTAGQQFRLGDLVEAMLLPSSNESCVAIAEYLAGSEDTFAGMMNEKAEEIGLRTAHFYNASGLPCFREDAAMSKMQNMMSALDLYHLAAILVKTHPEVTAITSLKADYLDSMAYTAYNSNPLLYNLPGITGLKTGTTVRAGACLVTLSEEELGGVRHQVISVLLDAETSAERCTKAEVLQRCISSMYS